MKIRLIACVLCLSAVCAAQSVSTKGEALDKVQVLALVAGELPHSRVASLLVERGITFEPRDRYVKLLQKAGADEGVIEAVRIATRTPATPSVGNSSAGNVPLNRDQILDLLETGVDSSALAKLVTARGIDFDPFDEYLHAYKIAGAQETLISTLQSAGEAKSPQPAPTPAALTGEGERPQVNNSGGKRVRVPGEIQAAKLISKINPNYPPLAKNARIQGTVRLSALIGLDGTIEDLKVISGQPLLIQSSMDAVSQWRYQPTLLSGSPVKVQTEIDVNFRLDF